MAKTAPDKRTVESPWSGHAKIPYHLMSEDEKRAAWAHVRERKQRTAKRHLLAPLVFGLLALALFVGSFFLEHYGARFAGGLMRWTGIGFVGFAIIAYVRSLFGSLSTRKDDLTPPGF